MTPVSLAALVAPASLGAGVASASLGALVAWASLAAWPGAVAAQATRPSPTDANAARLRAADTLGHVVGSPEAPVTVVEFSDPACPYCATFHDDVRSALVEEFVEAGQVRWITLTYVSGLYPDSRAAGLAMECAGAQGRYEAFLAHVYRERDRWLGAASAEAARAFTRFALEAGVDVEAWGACVTREGTPAASVDARLRSVAALARETGVRGTPTWFVDGFPVMGALPLPYARSFLVKRLERIGAGGSDPPAP